MNRKSLFGRFVNVDQAVRQEYFRLAMEPLEDRKMLTATVSNNWSEVSGSHVLHMGDIVTDNTLDNSVGNLVYGVNAFGKVQGITSLSGAGTITGSGATLTGAGLIQDAIRTSDLTGGVIDPTKQDTIIIENGTYAESDIVIDRPLIIDGDAGNSGDNGGQVTIVPEVASTHGETDFPTGSHQGIIIASGNIQIENDVPIVVERQWKRHGWHLSIPAGHHHAL